MEVTEVALHRLRLPLVAPFRTSFGTQTAREVTLVRVVTAAAEGWGECVAMAAPLYSSEYLDAADQVIERWLVPSLVADGGEVTAADAADRWAGIQGHRMAKAAVEMALLDAELRAAGRSFASAMGAVRDRVACGVSVGIMDGIPQLLDAVAGYLDEGYVRIKLKIEPGWDLEPVSAVRDRFGDILLQVDANAAYRLADADHLAGLDEFDLLLIEQPLHEERVLDHARLREMVGTPICLDESILSAASCADAIALGAVDIVNVKPGRMGGYLEALRVVEVCASHDVPVWCGGMLETGLGRAANVALAAGEHFTLPGDTSASSRYYARDIVTQPFAMVDGHLAVPTGPGLGVEVDPDALAAFTIATRRIWPADQPR